MKTIGNILITIGLWLVMHSKEPGRESEWVRVALSRQAQP